MCPARRLGASRVSKASPSRATSGTALLSRHPNDTDVENKERERLVSVPNGPAAVQGRPPH